MTGRPDPFCPTRLPIGDPPSARRKSACPGEVGDEFGFGLMIERDPGRLTGSATPGLAQRTVVDGVEAKLA